MTYADSFIVAVPKTKVAAYKQMSRMMAKVWLEHGATEYREWIADDVQPGKVTSFPRSVKRKPNETVVVALVGYKSRADRDRVHKKAMSDPRFAAMMNPKTMPFDGKRMIFGGFKPLVEGKAPAKAKARKSKPKRRK